VRDDERIGECRSPGSIVPRTRGKRKIDAVLGSSFASSWTSSRHAIAPASGDATRKREFVASSPRDCSRLARDVGYAEISVSPVQRIAEPDHESPPREAGKSGRLRENSSFQNSNLKKGKRQRRQRGGSDNPLLSLFHRRNSYSIEKLERRKWERREFRRVQEARGYTYVIECKERR